MVVDREHGTPCAQHHQRRMSAASRGGVGGAGSDADPRARSPLSDVTNAPIVGPPCLDGKVRSLKRSVDFCRSVMDDLYCNVLSWQATVAGLRDELLDEQGALTQSATAHHNLQLTTYAHVRGMERAADELLAELQEARTASAVLHVDLQQAQTASAVLRADNRELHRELGSLRSQLAASAGAGGGGGVMQPSLQASMALPLLPQPPLASTMPPSLQAQHVAQQPLPQAVSAQVLLVPPSLLQPDVMLPLPQLPPPLNVPGQVPAVPQPLPLAPVPLAVPVQVLPVLGAPKPAVRYLRINPAGAPNYPVVMHIVTRNALEEVVARERFNFSQKDCQGLSSRWHSGGNKPPLSRVELRALKVHKQIGKDNKARS